MSPFLLDNLATISLIAPRPSKTCPYDVNRTVAERGAFLIMRGRYDTLKFPPSVEIKRAVAAVEWAGIAISSIRAKLSSFRGKRLTTKPRN